MFGTSGIRGIANSDVGPELAVKVGTALGFPGTKIAIATDTRLAAPMIKHALVSGMLSCGSDVLDLGVVPTPVLSFVSQREKCSGVMVTASHNPKEYIGMKLFFEGRELAREQEKKIEKEILSPCIPKAPFDKAGVAAQFNALDGYFKFALSLVDLKSIRAKNPRIVVDCGNGAACGAMPYLLGLAGCSVLSVNSEPNGNFNRQLEPNARNLENTAKIVKASGALIGIAHDGDADRAIIIDEQGKVLALDTQLAMMATSELEKTGSKKIVVTTVEASLAVREAIEGAGAKVEITPVGSQHVASRLFASGGAFGGEPCGEYVFYGGTKSPDGLVAGLKFVEMLCKKGKISNLASKIKSYPIHRSKFQCSDKTGAMKKILAATSGMEGAASTVDGLRLDFEDGWFLIRPSGTEPYMRLTCECKSQKRLDKLAAELEAIIKKSVQ